MAYVIANLKDAELLDLLRRQRKMMAEAEAAADESTEDELELDAIHGEIADRIAEYIRMECRDAGDAIVAGFHASATWHQEPDAWTADSQTIVAAAQDYARRELQNFLDQKQS